MEIFFSHIIDGWLPFVELVPSVQNHLNKALQVAEAWGLDREAFREKAVKALKNEEE